MRAQGELEAAERHFDACLNLARSSLRERETLVTRLRAVLNHATFALEHTTGQGWSITAATQAILDEGAATGRERIVRRINPLAELSPRERDVLALLRARYSDREIAERLYISRRTASHHVGSIMAKLGAANRRDAAAVATHLDQGTP